MSTPYETIKPLLESTRLEDLQRGLELVRVEIARLGSQEARPLFEMVSSVFYIDPLDQPELMPVLDEAINLVVGFGNWVIPALVERLDAGDLKAQMAASHALGRIGADAIQPLMSEYGRREDRRFPGVCAVRPEQDPLAQGAASRAVGLGGGEI